MDSAPAEMANDLKIEAILLVRLGAAANLTSTFVVKKTADTPRVYNYKASCRPYHLGPVKSCDSSKVQIPESSPNA